MLVDLGRLPVEPLERCVYRRYLRVLVLVLVLVLVGSSLLVPTVRHVELILHIIFPQPPLIHSFSTTFIVLVVHAGTH